MTDKAVRLLPSWVEADPLRGRALDALGLQVTADRIADELIPGLSVLTYRARYFPFLAWARRVTGGARPDEGKIHRLEVALAVRESERHPVDEAEDDGGGGQCRFVGSRSLRANPRDKPPADPREVFRVPVWRAYRASMQSLRLLDGASALTDRGIALARAFAAACRNADCSGRGMLPRSACLSELTAGEARLLSNYLVGDRRKGKPRPEDLSPEGRRCALERELRPHFAGGYDLRHVLGAYENRRARHPPRVVAALREAAVWERLSVGLHAIFLLYLWNLNARRTVEHSIAVARRKRRVERLPFSEIAVDDRAAELAVQSVRRALALRDRLAVADGLPHCESEAFELGEALVSSGPAARVLQRLEERHLRTKVDEAWVRIMGQSTELVRHERTWQLPRKSTLHAYRLQAFGSIVADLKRALA